MTVDDDGGEAPAAQEPAAARAGTGSPTSSRFARFARLTGLSAGVAARHLRERVVGAFTDADTAEARKRAAQKQSAKEMTKTLGELKGAAMKVGQMLATDPELLPKEMVEELSRLHQSAPPMDFAVVKQAIEDAFGAPLSSLYAELSEQPIGAASIGQVHAGVTKDGQAVAVKVQYPGIAGTIQSDMKNLGSMLALARVALPKERVDQYVTEITEVIERESDYENEATNLERFQVVLKDVPGVRVPVPVHELTKKTVLTMELFRGQKLEDWLSAAPQGDRDMQGQRLLDAYVHMLHQHGALHADPHPGNFLVLDDEQRSIGLLDLGCVRDYPLEVMDEQLRFLVALWNHDVDALQRSWRKLGFLDDKVDPELIFEWCELMFSPLLKDEVTDFGAWRVQEQVIQFVLDHPTVKLWAPPRETLFYVRMLAGLRGLMQKAGIRINAYRFSRKAVAARGIDTRVARAAARS